MSDTKKMVQYKIWDNCNGNCQFCLIDHKQFLSKDEQLASIDLIRKNISYIDWVNEFNRGISILGGEVYNITDLDIQNAYYELLEDIIEKILIPNHTLYNNRLCKYSTVTNGNYDPSFLFKCIDKIITSVDIDAIDINFSYDIKYRYPNKETEDRVLNNISLFQKVYPNYKLGVQSICAQYLIDEILNNNFLEKWYDKNPNTFFNLLYPHKYHTGIELYDFFPKRSDIFRLLTYLQKNNYEDTLLHFHASVQNSAIFKYTGLYDKDKIFKNTDFKQQPILSREKTNINPSCGHSTLYKCYSDCDNCILCDMNMLLGI